MAIKLTFKEYLESKEKLREAIAVTPKQTKQYTVKKYCKLVIGESKDEKEQLNLKPNQKIIIEWVYKNIDEPTPVKIMFEGVCPDVDSEDYTTYWQSLKLQKWLLKNTCEDERS